MAEHSHTNIILASASPRRRELLEQLGLTLTIISPDVDESARPSEDPVAYVCRVAAEKVFAVPAPADSLVIAADTTVDIDGEILAKPDDAQHAAAMLRRLSTRTHRVHTGVALRLGDRHVVDVVTSLVTFVPLTDATIEWYIGTGEPFGKAGAYAIQGAGGVLVQRVRGSVSNIVGLPLHAVARMANELGVSLLG